MESLSDPRSTIDDEIAAFGDDVETALAESTIADLMATHPENRKVEHILIKVITINTLYHARVLDIDLQPLANHLLKLDLDAILNAGDPKAVDLIWNSEGTRRKYFSFATKFCSWHNQAAYAIYDLNAWEALIAYRCKDGPFHFRNNECRDYAGYLGAVRRFQKTFGLEDYSLKKIDKFLWIVGGRLIAQRTRALSEPPVAVEEQRT